MQGYGYHKPEVGLLPTTANCQHSKHSHGAISTLYIPYIDVWRYDIPFISAGMPKSKKREIHSPVLLSTPKRQYYRHCLLVHIRNLDAAVNTLQ